MYTRDLDRSARAEVDEMLELPFGMHPDATPQAKRDRAAFFANLQNEGG